MNSGYIIYLVMVASLVVGIVGALAGLVMIGVGMVGYGALLAEAIIVTGAFVWVSVLCWIYFTEPGT